MEREFLVKYVVEYQRTVRSVGIEAAAERAKRSIDAIKGAKLLAVYDMQKAPQTQEETA